MARQTESLGKNRVASINFELVKAKSKSIIYLTHGEIENPKANPWILVGLHVEERLTDQPVKELQTTHAFTG
jgi:hypothetical protein